MVIINTVSSQRFSLDGIEYFKNFLSRVYGTKIKIYNAYDTKDVLLEAENFDNVELNGVVYASEVLLQEALLNVIYTRDSLNGIVQNSEYFNRFTNNTGVSLVDNELTINAGWAWEIQGAPFSLSSDFIITFPYAATGYHRIDLIVATTNNEFLRIAGEEVLTSLPRFEPAPLPNTLRFTSFEVNDSSVADAPSNLYSEWQLVEHASGNSGGFIQLNDLARGRIDVDNYCLLGRYENYTSDGNTNNPLNYEILSTGDNTGDNAVNTLYSGLEASKQNTLVAGTNITIDNTNPLAPIISTSGGGSSSVITTYKTATSSNLTTQDVTGFLAYVNGVSSFAIAANEIVKYTITGTGQIFEIKATGTARSVGSGQTALLPADVLEIEKSKIFNVENYANWRFLKADALGGGQAAISFISSFSWTVVGSVTNKTSTYGTGNFIDTVRRVGLASAASAGSTASRITNSGIQCSTLSGFYVCADSVYSDPATVATTRAAIGIGDLASGIGNNEPSTRGSCVLLGKDTGDTNMQIMHNDNVGTCTKVDLGSNFPATTNNTDVYRLELFCFPVGTAIYYRVTRLNTGNVYESVITTNYPLNNAPLLFILHRNNSSTALAVDYAFSQILIATPY